MKTSFSPFLRPAREHRGAAPAEVEVWSVSLEAPPVTRARLRDALSADERSRAAVFHSSRLRARFLTARGLLRVLLASHLGCSPRDLRFRYGAHGKPFLDAGHGRERLRFSVSHCDALGVFALSYDCELGVDIERIRPVSSLEQVARRFLSPPERAALQTVPAEEHWRALLLWWVRREACAKALGCGMAASLRCFDVPVAPETAVSTVWMRENGVDGARWALRDLAVQPGHVAALAAQAEEVRVRTWV